MTSLQIVFGALVFVLGTGLAKYAGETAWQDGGFVRLALCVFGIVAGGLTALIGLLSLIS